MGKLLKIGEAAIYLNVSQDTLRKWDKADKLKPLETAGGHRRYDTDTLDEFLGRKSVAHYASLYNHLCSAQDIAYKIKDESAEDIERIRIVIGEKLLKMYE